jgi:hypothetical protein
LSAGQLLITSFSHCVTGLLFVADLGTKRAIICSAAQALTAQAPEAFFSV